MIYYISRAEKGDEWEDHKYVDRIPKKGGGWTYIYPWDLVNKGRQKATEVAQNVKSKAQTVTQNVRNTVQNTTQNIKNTAKETANKIVQDAKKIQSTNNITFNGIGSTIDKMKDSNQKISDVELDRTTRNVLNTATNNIKDTKIGSISLNTDDPFIQKIKKSIEEPAKSTIGKIVKGIIKFIMPDDLDNSIRKSMRVEDKNSKEFDNDAEDSFEENRNIHTELKQKESSSTRDDDMMAVNAKLKRNLEREGSSLEDFNNTLNDYMKEYNESGYTPELEKKYDKFINLYAKNYRKGCLTNCENCTMAYDMRRRGYDVEAPANLTGMTSKEVQNLYYMDKSDVHDLPNQNTFYDLDGEMGIDNSAVPYTEEEIQQAREDMLDRYPEGSYGHMEVVWAQGGAHSIVWSIEDGDVVIRDCQVGEVTTLEDIMSRSLAAREYRTDDKELSELAYDMMKSENVTDYKRSGKYVYDYLHSHKEKKKRNAV